jgi:nicotinate-nucleotide pyrophosphorylase (carboxylating)
MNFREAGVVAGIELARLAFATLDASARREVLCADGTHVEPDTTILRIEGRGAAILTAERVALNFVQRLSGIATLTQQFVQAVAGTDVLIADTRKTTPGLRLLEKYAVRCGGGSNHRFALDDMVLIKDNHIALCGGIEPAVQRARENIGHSVKIEVECDTLPQVEQAIAAGVDIILLDNMTPQQMQNAVQKIRDSGQKILAEASGGINLQTVRAAAESGVDIISVGALTHSARALDIGLDVEIRA